MRININPSDTPSAIEQKILRATQNMLNSVFHRAIPSINKRFQSAIDGIIQGTPEYQSLVDGELMAEFGLSDPESRLRQILNALQHGVEATTYPVRVISGKLEGGVVWKILKSDFAEILGLPAATYVSQPSGETIPWLDWLLTRGDQIIIYSHEIFYDLSDKQRATSRSGKALMRPGSGWRVPPEFAGTVDSNFITRAFDVPSVEQLLENIVVQEIESRIR